MTKRAKVVITGTAYMARPDAEHQPEKWYVPENVHATVQFNDNGPIGWAALNKWDDGRIHAVVTFPAIDPELLTLCPYLGISVFIHPDGSGDVRGVAIVDENVDKEVPRYAATVEYLDDKPNNGRVIPAPDVISLADLRRLDLRPGDTLAIVAPSENVQVLARLTEQVQQILDEFHPGTHVMAFPEGTDLSVIPAEGRTEPRRFTYPVGGLPHAPTPEQLEQFDEWIRQHPVGIEDPS